MAVDYCKQTLQLASSARCGFVLKMFSGRSMWELVSLMLEVPRAAAAAAVPSTPTPAETSPLWWISVGVVGARTQPVCNRCPEDVGINVCHIAGVNATDTDGVAVLFLHVSNAMLKCLGFGQEECIQAVTRQIPFTNVSFLYSVAFSGGCSQRLTRWRV